MSDEYKVEIEAYNFSHREILVYRTRANSMQEAIDSSMEKALVENYQWNDGRPIEFIPLSVRRFINK